LYYVIEKDGRRGEKKKRRKESERDIVIKRHQSGPLTHSYLGVFYSQGKRGQEGRACRIKHARNWIEEKYGRKKKHGNVGGKIV
jgi:hypothetical protein